MTTKSILRGLVPGFVAFSAAAHATIIVNSHDFFGITDGGVSTDGTSDWGFISTAGGFFSSNLDGAGLSYDDTGFDSLSNDAGVVLTTVSDSSTIGAVILTEGISGADVVVSQNNVPNYTFDGTATHGAYGNFGPDEADVWRMTFNDLGVGQHLIRIYMGHSSNDRVFDMDVSFDGGANTVVTTTSPQISTLGSTVAAYGATGSAFSYDIDVTVSAPSDDLTLTFGGVSGGFGGAILAGYTVTTNPGGGGPLTITEIDYSVETNEVTLTWDSNETDTYVVRYSEDLSDWDTPALGMPVSGDAGDITTETFSLGGLDLADISRLFFRVELQTPE